MTNIYYKLSNGKFVIPALLLAILALTFLIYMPGLRGDFIFDDFANIVNNSDSHLAQLTFAEFSKVLSSGVASVISRPLSMLTFGFNHYFTGLEPYYFKITNLFIHLLISLGIYLLTVELLKIGANKRPDNRKTQQLVALFITACWALHPLNVSTVLYVVQRMNQLATLAEVYTLLYYCKFRQRDTADKRQAVIAIGVVGLLTVIGVMFKENAVLVVLFILTIEIFLLRFKTGSEGQRMFLKSFIAVMVITPAILGLLILVIAPERIIGGYDTRNFTMGERLLTEARVLWMYISWLIMPDTREFYFYHDNYPISRSLVDPLSTLVAIAGLAGLSTFAWLLRHKMPLLCFGIAFFLAGHVLESTIISLELVFEHRNYLPGFGLLFGGIHTLLNFPGAIISRKAAGAFLTIFWVFLAHGTWLEARKWSNTYEQLLATVRENPDSHRGNYALGFYYLTAASLIEDNTAILDAASYYYGRAATLDPTALRGFTGVILANGQNNKPVEPMIIDELENRLRSNPLGDNALTEVSMLTECWYGNFCKFEKALLIRLYNAIARNEASEPIVIQAILDQLGTALYGVFNAREDGMALLYLASNLNDELTIIDLKLIRMEMAAKNYPKAQQLVIGGRAKKGNGELKRQLQALSDELEVFL